MSSGELSHTVIAGAVVAASLTPREKLPPPHEEVLTPLSVVACAVKEKRNQQLNGHTCPALYKITAMYCKSLLIKILHLLLIQSL